MSEQIVLSRRQVREVDRRAVEDYGIPGIVLMENASLALARAVNERLGTVLNPRVVIIAGSGNNGGDGFALARHLHNAQVELTVLLVGETAKISGDALTNLEIVKQMHLDIRVLSRDATGLGQLQAELARADLLVDALLGTGLSGEVRGFYRQVIESLNSSGKDILAVDIPSGLDCDTGIPLGLAVRAKTTVTFVARKKGFDAPGAEAYTGRVIVGDIGAPRELIRMV